MLTFPSALQQLNAAGLPFTAIPNGILDHLPDFSPSELATLLYICRHTLGYHKLADTISYDQFLHGIITQDGRRLDEGTGVSRRALIAALRSLEERGFIQRHSQGQRRAVLFALRLEIYQTEAEVQNLHSAQECDLAQKVDSYEEQKCNLGQEEQAQNCYLAKEQKCDPWDNYEEQKSDLGQLEEVQILPVEEALAEQKCDPPKEKLLTQNINRSGGGELTAACQLLEQSLPGLTRTEAYKLADTCLRRYGRGLAYLIQLVDYVNSSSNIRNPAAFLTSLINSNTERTATRPAPTQSIQPAPSRSGIDFSKYGPGGKYGYLTRRSKETSFAIA